MKTDAYHELQEVSVTFLGWHAHTCPTLTQKSELDLVSCLKMCGQVVLISSIFTFAVIFIDIMR